MPIAGRFEGRVGVGVDVQELYSTQRRSLVRLAWLLTHDQADAEEIVQDAFVKAHLCLRRLRDPDKATAYLRSMVLNGARSRLRHLKVVERRAPGPGPDSPSAEIGALHGVQHQVVLAALSELPRRQKECLVLRYYLDLSQDEIAQALGVSAGSVKTHLHRGLATLSQLLQNEREDGR